MKPIDTFRTLLFSVCLVLIGGTSEAVAQEATDSVAPAIRQGEAVVAAGKSVADEAYVAGNYEQAIALYEQLLSQQGEAPAVYYNLGNSYYKSGQLAKAILNYERALMMNPGDGDIRFNLELARSKTVDKITPMSEMFFIAWARDLANLLSANAWAKCGIASFLLFIIALSAYIFGRRLAVRKAAFFLALFLLVVCVVANASASYQKGVRQSRANAIVMLPTVSVKSTPDKSGTDLFVLHEGCKVEIKDDSMSGWKEIRLSDGNVGWLPASAIEVI